MTGPRALLASPVFLITGIVVIAGGALAALFPMADYITNRSVSTTDNFYLIGGMMLALTLLAVLEALMVVRLIWGKGAITGEQKREGKSDHDDDLANVRTMRVTGMKKALVFGVFLGANILIFDLVGGGVLVTGTRRNHVLTQLRSDRPEDRKAAVEDSIQLVGDKEVAVALGKIMKSDGQGREWAAYAAGVRHDLQLRDALAELLREGTGVERAAAAMALARMKDPRLFRLVVDSYDGAGKHRGDLLIAMGMLGKIKGVTSDADLDEAGQFLSDLLEGGKLDKEQTRLAIWVLGMMETPRGLPYLKSLLKKDTDTTTLCVTLEALGKIGEAASTDNMMAIVNDVDRKARCPELVASDFTGHEVLLSGGLNLVERILREVANIGDDQNKMKLERIAADETHSETVRKMAAEIAFQMRYRPVDQK